MIARFAELAQHRSILLFIVTSMQNESESENEREDNVGGDIVPIISDDGAATTRTQRESEKTAHYFVFSGDNKAGMHGYEKVYFNCVT